MAWYVSTMQAVYIIVESGDAYDSAYTTFSAAVQAVKDRHKETLDYEKEVFEEEGFEIGAGIDVPEEANGTTKLFIESIKLNITISRLPVKSH